MPASDSSGKLGGIDAYLRPALVLSKDPVIEDGPVTAEDGGVGMRIALALSKELRVDGSVGRRMALVLSKVSVEGEPSGSFAKSGMENGKPEPRLWCTRLVARLDGGAVVVTVSGVAGWKLKVTLLLGIVGMTGAVAVSVLSGGSVCVA